MKEKISDRTGIAVLIMAIVVAIAVAGLLSGCSPKTVYVPVENGSARTDTLQVFRFRTDSVVVRDSVTVFVKGDTVITDRWHYGERVRLRVDTLRELRTDSVFVSKPYPVEVRVDVPRKTPWWERMFTVIGVAAVLFTAGKFALKKWV